MNRSFAVKSVFAFAMFSVGVVSAAEHYVSSTGKYVTDDFVEHGAYIDLQSAVNDAGNDDVIWVDDGYVCDSGQYEYATGYFCRLYVNKALTIRSRCGDGRQTNAPVIRGAFSSPGAEGIARCGTGAVACFRGKGKGYVRLVGFRLENGATSVYASNVYASGGGAYGATLDSCVVSHCAAYVGGGVRACDTTGCMIVDCHAYNGGGIYDDSHEDAWIESCTAANCGGGGIGTISDSVITNCAAVAYGGGFGLGGSMYRISSSTIVDCRVTSNYGGGAYNADVRGCRIVRCNRGALTNCKATDCEVTGCTGGSTSTYDFGSAMCFRSGAAFASNCTFRCNGSPVIGAENGATGAQIAGCTFEDNDGSVIANDHNNVILTIVDSVIRCTNSAAYAIYVRPWSSGTSPDAVEVYNSVIVGPVRACGDFHNCLISNGVSDNAPAVYCDAAMALHTNPERSLRLYNCTVIDNESRQSAGGAAGGYVDAYNTVFHRNSSAASVSDSLRTAKNCCLDAGVAVTGESSSTIRDDPLFMTDDRGLPHPSESSPCRSAGSSEYVFTETDLAGNPRLSGNTVAIGACEFDPTIAGAEISCQIEAARAPANGVYSASVSGLGIQGITYYWDLDSDGNTDFVTTEPACRYSYPEAGEYVVTLFVSNAVKGVKTTFNIAIPEGFYVSKKEIGTDGRGIFTAEDGYRHSAYTNLQQAIDAASAGDTVWVDADFICGEGARRDSTGPLSRILITKPLTVRGQTGDGRTGPVIRGSFNAPEATGNNRLGDNAVACVRGNDKTSITLIGLRLQNGATSKVNSLANSCGGGASQVTLRNCLVESCAAMYGGGIKDCDSYDCEFRDCYTSNHGAAIYDGVHSNALIGACQASGHGGGAYFSSVSDANILENSSVTNCSASYGGAVRGGQSRDCVFTSCTAGNYGGASYQTDLVGCVISNCNAAASYGGRVRDCIYVDNFGCSSGSAYLFYENETSWVSNCIFQANSDPAIGSNSTLDSAVIEDCFFTNNLGSAMLVGCYNKSTQIVARHCKISGTPASSQAIRSRRYNTSGNINRVTVCNSVIEGAVSGSGDYYNCLIANGNSTIQQAVVFCDEAAATYSGTTVPLTLVNTTVTGNESTKATGGAGGGYVVAVNSIVWGNIGKDGTTDSFLAATNCCLEADAVIGDAAGCVFGDPRFIGTVNEPFVPKASKCRNAGQIFDWMSNSDDIRSLDLGGNPRLRDGKVDIGAFQMHGIKGITVLFL